MLRIIVERGAQLRNSVVHHGFHHHPPRPAGFEQLVGRYGIAFGPNEVHEHIHRFGLQREHVIAAHQLVATTPKSDANVTVVNGVAANDVITTPCRNVNPTVVPGYVVALYCLCPAPIYEDPDNIVYDLR